MARKPKPKEEKKTVSEHKLTLPKEEEKTVSEQKLTLPMTKEEYDPGKLNKLSYEEEMICWYNYVYRGNQEKEWSFKVLVVGSVLACLMVLVNIYMGLKTGWGEGGSIIAVLLAFLFLGTLLKCGLIEYYGMLETNMIQTMASAGGSLGNLVNVVPALLLMGYVLDWYDMFALVFITSFMGVFFAIPLRRQNVIIEKLRFPSGTACYQTIKAVHEKTPESQQKAYALAVSGGLTMLFTFLRDFMPRIKGWVGGTAESLRMKFIDCLTIPESTHLSTDKLLQRVDWGIAWSPLLFGIGFITGPRVGIGMIVGGVIGYILLPETLLRLGYIESFRFGEIRDWLMWPSTSLMVFASFVALAFQFPVIMRAFRGIKRDKSQESTKTKEGSVQDTLEKISELEVPRPILLLCVGGAVLAAIIFMGTRFEIQPLMAVFAIAFSFVLAMIAVRAAGETDINPVGAMGHVTQIAYGALFSCTPRGNLGASGITAAGASEAGDMMQDLKTGYLLGATPKRQVYIQLLGVFIGSIIAVILLYTLLYDKDGALTIKEKPIIQTTYLDKDGLPTTKEKAISQKDQIVIQRSLYPAPAAHVWKALALAMSRGDALFDIHDFQDPHSLITMLKDPKDPLSRAIRDGLTPYSLEVLKKYDGDGIPSENFQKLLADELNRLLRKGPIYNKDLFKDITLREDTQKYLQTGRPEDTVLINRCLLEDAYPKLFARRLWLALKDFKNIQKFIEKLQKAEDALSAYLKTQLTSKTQELLAGYDGKSQPSAELQKAILHDINQVLDKPLYEEKRFAHITLSEDLKKAASTPSSGDVLMMINRTLIQESYSHEISRPHEGLPKGAVLGIIIAAILGILLGLIDQTKFGKWMPSTIGLGVALIIPLSYCVSIFLGSIVQWIVLKAKPKSQELIGPIAAGTIAGEPIVGTLANIIP